MICWNSLPMSTHPHAESLRPPTPHTYDSKKTPTCNTCGDAKWKAESTFEDFSRITVCICKCRSASAVNIFSLVSHLLDKSVAVATQHLRTCMQSLRPETGIEGAGVCHTEKLLFWHTHKLKEFFTLVFLDEHLLLFIIFSCLRTECRLSGQCHWIYEDSSAPWITVFCQIISRPWQK